MKKVFIAATKQNDGKTTVSLGLVSNFQKKFKKVGNGKSENIKAAGNIADGC